MNERIKELALQAGYKHLPTVRLAFQGFDKQKFAELIVKECAQVAADFVPGYGLVPGSKRFKEHYGVEE